MICRRLCKRVRVSSRFFVVDGYNVGGTTGCSLEGRHLGAISCLPNRPYQASSMALSKEGILSNLDRRTEI